MGVSSIRLASCPRCGGKAKLKRGLPGLQGVKYRFALVQCLGCNFRTETFRKRPGEDSRETDRRAAEAWNELSGGIAQK